MAGTEIDVRSWTKWDTGDPLSYIRINGEDVPMSKAGLYVVTVDIKAGGKILKQKHFPLHKHSPGGKNGNLHKTMLREWLAFLKPLNDQQLVIMAIHDHCHVSRFRKQLGVGLPPILEQLNITE